jgi:hypothetical protein
MPYGFGLGRGAGRGFSGGMGFSFRGSSPHWPYVGIGRGGLPRCGYYLSAILGSPANWPFFTPRVTPEQELDFLRNQAEAIRGQLEEIERRMCELVDEK